MSSPRPILNGRGVILRKVIEATAGLTQDWDHAFADPIAAETRLVADLGCQSLDIVVLTADLSRQLQRTDIPFERLLLPNGKPAADISVGTLADFLWEHTQASDPATQ